MSLSRTALGFLLLVSQAIGQETIGVLSHIAAGGGWTTVITLVGNIAPSKIGPLKNVQVRFYDDNGIALSMPLTTTQQGRSQTTTTAVVSIDPSLNATTLISIGDHIASTVVGWAEVAGESLDGFAIFRYTPQNGPASEGTVPLQKVPGPASSASPSSSLRLPYDDTAGSVMGVALANSSTFSTTITAIIFDENGMQLGTQNIRIAGNGHTSFVLPNQIPLTAGRRGIVQFVTASPTGLAGLGLRFSPLGTFTSVRPCDRLKIKMSTNDCCPHRIHVLNASTGGASTHFEHHIRCLIDILYPAK
jgi:hypothetical protein